jgi:SprT protein
MRGTVECIDQVYYYVDLLKTKCGIHLPRPRITFNLRGTTAGRAYYRENRVAFNPILLDENPEHFVKQTVGHEVAHLAAFVKHGGRIDPHGREWKHVMWQLSLPAKRCHSYDVSTITGQRSKPLCREILE